MANVFHYPGPGPAVRDGPQRAHAHPQQPSLVAADRPNESRNGLSLPGSPSPALRENLEGRSRIVRLINLRSTPPHLLWSLFSHAAAQINLSPPTRLFPHPHLPDSPTTPIWAGFSSPQDARAALSLSCEIFAVQPALEPDLAPINSSTRVFPPSSARDSLLRRVHTLPIAPPRSDDMIPQHYPTPARFPGHPAHGSAHGEDLSLPFPPFLISSNPPNPKTSFRAGDWMCSGPNCSAHNFQRNATCIVCGRPRGGNPIPLSAESPTSPSFPLVHPSPRFTGRFNNPQTASRTPPSSVTTSGFPNHTASSALAAAHAQMPSKAPPPQYPPLTPSGRALSVGGRVRNISRDPLSPCVMYWPDNEPLPEPCQIRPIDSALMTFPPIINTGNKGVAEKQPGDWLCGKCNYHNWRRRKVCQTCYPYAEGNGDSISGQVQAERIALLANVLATQFNALDLNGVPNQPLSSHDRMARQPPPSSAPPYQMRFSDGPNPTLRRGVSPSPLLPTRTLSEQEKVMSPIYQTSGHGRVHDHAGQVYPMMFSSSPQESRLLPSFLKEIVHSPAQSPSPTSSSSAELSFDGSSEDMHYVLGRMATMTTTDTSHLPGSNRGEGDGQASSSGVCTRKSSNSSFGSIGRSSGSSIWKLDGEETRTLSSTSSTRTSPTTAFAKAVPSPRSATVPTTVDASATFDSGTTPKSNDGFWQARYHH